MTEKRYGIIRSELGYCIHVSLRKSCDSKATSLAWNLIGMKEFNDAWGRYLDLVWSSMESYRVYESLRDAINDLPYTDSHCASLRLVLELLDNDDWDGLCSGIEYYVEGG